MLPGRAVDRHQTVFLNVAETRKIEIAAHEHFVCRAAGRADHQGRASEHLLQVEHGVAEHHGSSLDSGLDYGVQFLAMIGGELRQHGLPGPRQNRQDAFDIESFQ